MIYNSQGQVSRHGQGGYGFKIFDYGFKNGNQLFDTNKW